MRRGQTGIDIAALIAAAIVLYLVVSPSDSGPKGLLFSGPDKEQTVSLDTSAVPRR